MKEKDMGFINGQSSWLLWSNTQEKKHQGATLIAKHKSLQLLEKARQSCVHTQQFSYCLALILPTLRSILIQLRIK